MAKDMNVSRERASSLERQNNTVQQSVNQADASGMQKTQGTSRTRYSDAELAEKKQWYINTYRPQTIAKIRHAVGIEVSETVTDAMIEAVAVWQEKNRIQIDGKFGTSAIKKSGLKISPKSFFDDGKFFEVMEEFGITDETERNIFLANAHHETGGGKRLSENMNYSLGRYVEGADDNKGWLATFSTGRSYKTAYETDNNGKSLPGGSKDFATYFTTLTPEDKANIVYGIEGKNYIQKVETKYKVTIHDKGYTCDDLGNTIAGEGYKFRGRGYVQTTGKKAYQSLENYLNEPAKGEDKRTVYQKLTGNEGKADLMNKPDIIAENQTLAMIAGAYFWHKNAADRIVNVCNGNPTDLAGAKALNRKDKNLRTIKENYGITKALRAGRRVIAGGTDVGDSASIKGMDDVIKKYNDNLENYNEAYANYVANKNNPASSQSKTIENTSTQTPVTQADKIPATSTPNTASQADKIPATSTPNTASQAGKLSDDLLTQQEIDEAMAWFGTKNYRVDFIMELQQAVKAPLTGVVSEETVRRIAVWQKANRILVDGKFGGGSAEKANLTIRTNADVTQQAPSTSAPGTVANTTTTSSSAPARSPETSSRFSTLASQAFNRFFSIFGSAGSKSDNVSRKNDNKRSENTQNQAKNNATTDASKNTESKTPGSVDASLPWKDYVVASGIPENEVYTGDKQVPLNGGSLKQVKTLQASLNRVLEGVITEPLKADSKQVQVKLDVDGKWGLNTRAHLMYYLFMLGKLTGNGKSACHDGCTQDVWAALREKRATKYKLDCTDAYEDGNSLGAVSLEKAQGTDGSTGLVNSIGLRGFDALKEDLKSKNMEIGIEASYRCMSTAGLRKLNGVAHNTGQIELYAKNNGKGTNPPGFSNHQQGSAFDFKWCSVKNDQGQSVSTQYGRDLEKIVHGNKSRYKMTRLSSEWWHYDVKR